MTESFRNIIKDTEKKIIQSAMVQMKETMDLADNSFDYDTAKYYIRDAVKKEFDELVHNIEYYLDEDEDDMIAGLTDLAIDKGYDYEISI